MRALTLKTLAVAVLVQFGAASHAADAPTREQIEALCKDEPGPAAYFPAMRAAAIKVAQQACLAGDDHVQVANAVVAFIDAEAKAARLVAFGFDPATNPMTAALNRIDLAREELPGMALASPDAPVLAVAGAGRFMPANVATCDSLANTVVAGTDCINVVDDFAQFYTYAQKAYAWRGALAFSRSAAGFREGWETFFENTRSQTYLEQVVNAARYRRNEKSHFGGPPTSQIILFHPNVVIENVKGALDGEKTKEAFMIEVVGMNWWKERPWYYPSGASLIALYSDRTGNDDVGYGLAIHFKGVYTLGYSIHDDEGGVFASADLLKFFADKKSLIEAYLK